MNAEIDSRRVESPRFVILGAAGFVAPRHLEAIRAVGGQLVAACDPHDSVGILDRYFPDTRFFREFERLDRHIEKVRRSGHPVDYVSICSPNYLHDAHVRFALRVGAHAICEKPLVINPWNVGPLVELAEERGRCIYPVLQLREHPAIVGLRERSLAESARHHEVDLTYLTARGPWYLSSWKGSEERSGGLVSNIGVHFIDMLLWVFGAARDCVVHRRTPTVVAGRLELERATVRWVLGIDRRLLPPGTAGSRPTHRSIRVDGEELDFSGGFAQLHDRVYEKVVAGDSWGPGDALPAIELTRAIRDAEPDGEGVSLPWGVALEES